MAKARKKPVESTKSAVKSRKRAAKSRKNAAKSRKAATRERIDTGTDTRLVRRGAGGQFKESDDVGRAAARDQRTKAKASAKRGQGDRGDRKR